MDQKKFPIEFVEKTTPVNNDILLIADSADSNKVKKIKYSNVKGAKGDSVTWRGAYNGATAYAVNDAVSYNGVSYICILASTGNLPTNVTYWAVMVQVSSATDTGQGAVRLADAAQSIAGTDTESGEPLVPQPSHVKAVRDLVTAEALKIKSKEDVVCATTANITLSGAQTIDGVSAVAGNRVLVKNQSTASQNGIYVVAAGAWTRATDFDTNVNNEVDFGACIYIQAGTVNTGKIFILSTTGSITVGSTALTFTQVYPQTPISDNTYTTPSATTVLTANTTRTTNSTSDVLVKEFTVYCDGGTRVGFDLNNSSGGTPSVATVKVNDVSVGTASHTGLYGASYTVDFNFKGWAKVSVYYRSFHVANNFSLSNCFVGYTLTTGAVQAVNTD